MKKINCKQCGIEKMVFRADIKRGKAKFCSQKCSVLFHTKWVTKPCDGCSKEFRRHPYKISDSHKNYCSHKCFLTTSTEFKEATRGEKNRLWNGGKCKPWRNNTPAYRKWRIEILKTHGKKCEYCGSVERLEIDHLWPYKYWPNLALHPLNAQVLCHECHKKTFTYGQRNTSFLIDVKDKLGDDVINFPAIEQILEARRQVKHNLGI